MPPIPNPHTLQQLAERVGARLEGDPSLEITGIAPIGSATGNDLTFLANSRYQGELARCNAGAVILSEHQPGLTMAQLVVADPYYAYATLLTMLYTVPRSATGISPDARVACPVGDDPDIAAFVTVGDGSVIGHRVTLHAGVRIGRNCVIGDDVTLHPNVVVRDGCRLGHRVIIQSGAVIGSDGFGYATHNGVHHKIPHVGNVVLEDDVEIGANVTIDRGALEDTRVGAGTKVDNLVQIAHNARLGRACLLVSQSGVAGSSELGDYVVLGGQVGVAGHVKIGKGTQVGGKAGVNKSIGPGLVVSGHPLLPLREHLKVLAVTARLPELRDRVNVLEKRLAEGSDQHAESV